ncbi:MAG: CocE/NonD family hydrolase [Candidatus Thermoplasmatota archaeon]
MRSLSGLLAVALLLAGCANTNDGTSGDRQGAADKILTSASVTSYLHDLSPVIPGLSVAAATVEQYRIQVAEGITLDAWVARPAVAGPVPLVLTVTPYYAGGSPVAADGTHSLGRLGDELVARGYAVGVSSVRGTGLSDGCFTQGGAQEALDTTTVIEFLASQPWSNGNVGLIGVSYDGTTPQDAWVAGSPSLKTVVPISGISDLYKYNFVNGVPINVQGFGFNTYYWVLTGAVPFPLGGVPTDPASVPGAVVGEACTEQAEVQEGGVSSTMDGNKDAYWMERDFLAELASEPDAERASVFYVHGLQDWNVKDHNMEDWLTAIQATGVPFKAWLGQWGHAWPQSTGTTATCEVGSDGVGGSCRNDWWELTLIAWFDQFLKGINTGVLDAPAVQVQDDDGVWRHEAVWPPTDVTWRTFHLDQPGALGDAPGSGTASYFDAYGALLETNAGLAFPTDTPTQVAFVSQPLEADTQVSGLPRFVGNVTASGDRSSLVLTLAERFADGTERSFNFAALSLNHVEGLNAARTDIAGVRQEITLDFFPADDVLHSGSRIVLYAAGNTIGSDYGGGPSLQPITDGSTLTLDLEGARLLLPVDLDLIFETPQPYDA